MTRVVRFVLIIATVVVIGYSGYVGMVGSEALLRPDRAAGCATPATEYGWAYEAINYERGLDPSTAGSSCDIGPTSSRDVVAADGVPITGWYIPAGSPTTESAAVVLIHGWNADPSSMLEAAALLHDDHDLLLVGLRRGGRSGDADITFGVRERDDVAAVLDWLEATHPHATIVLLGESMGGAVALATAAVDERVDGVIVDSTHASFVTVLERRLAVEEGHPPQPGALAIALGAWIRTGHDLRSVDPQATVRALGSRPLLIVHGSADVIDVPDQSAEVIAAAALDSGVSTELSYCPGGEHGTLTEDCPTAWADRVIRFIEQVRQGEVAP
jgi:pimeloyl-ACP methyl ester carboxylesterase